MPRDVDTEWGNHAMDPRETIADRHEMWTYVQEHHDGKRHHLELNGGTSVVVVTCETCGDVVRMNDALALSGVARCFVCNGIMTIQRWLVAQRVRKAPYSFGRGFASSETYVEADPCYSIVPYRLTRFSACVELVARA